jgi:nucleoside 2-deoxyribosyltransferase
MRLYWANSIFCEADRRFNDLVVGRLQASGINVLSPQHLPFNTAGHDATAATIFRTDTSMIESCDVLAACIDQESIDCGVACEIGIAWALRKRIVALYTDFRQHRSGQFRMYKNPYVVGCIQDRGLIVDTVDALVDHLTNLPSTNP